MPPLLTYKFTPSPFFFPCLTSLYFSLSHSLISSPFLFFHSNTTKHIAEKNFISQFSLSSNFLCSSIPLFYLFSFVRQKMTNQNVIISDPRSGFDSSLLSFSPAVPGPLPQPGRFIAVPAKKSFKSIDSAEAARINVLLDSMRASSPTRRTSETENLKSWIVHHPSALKMFDEIINASKGKQIVVFLDYDGTLSPIVDDPDKAFMTSEMREAVRNTSKYFPTAIVSGRCRAKVFNFVKLSELYYAGSHGMDIKAPVKGRSSRKGNNQTVLCQPAREFLPMINEVYKSLVEKTKSIPGAKVENNKFCLSVHFRRVEEKRWTELAEQVKSVTKEYPRLRLTQGRKVLEIRPSIKWDKGNALEFLLESLGYANSNDVLPIYIGDDRTDEDAFKVLRGSGQGFGILVSKSPKETNASYSLQEPLEVMYFLNRLVEWKKSSLQQRYQKK